MVSVRHFATGFYNKSVQPVCISRFIDYLEYILDSWNRTDYLCISLPLNLTVFESLALGLLIRLKKKALIKPMRNPV